MTNKAICFYHSADLDGHCSGAILRRFHEILPKDYELLELRGINYGEAFPWELIDGETTVYMVDFSIQPFDQMVRLLGECKQLVWIDHHETAINEYGSYEREHVGFQIAGTRKVGEAACELCWRWFFGGRFMTDVNMPQAVRLIGRYDVWDKTNPDVEPFQWGMRSYSETRPEQVYEGLWKDLLDDDIVMAGRIRDAGHRLLAFQRAQDEKYCRAYAFDALLGGLRVVALNKGMANSETFRSVYDPERHDAMCLFARKKNGRWLVSLYSAKPEVDVGSFCKGRSPDGGGGGHANAAGYESLDCPFARPGSTEEMLSR